MLDARLIYTGPIDYWGGFDNQIGEYISEHLLYAYYDRDTSLRDIIDQLVEDSWTGPASETIPKGITQDDVRAALLNRMLRKPGRADYHKGIIAECSTQWMEANNEYDSEYGTDGDDDDYESPIFIALLTYHKD